MCAEHASVSLRYSRAKNASACPDEATFRGLVAARLGYDPFTGAIERALAIDFERKGNEVVGRLSFDGEKGEKRTERTLRAGADECFELATSMALVAAVALDPEALQTPAEPAPAPQPAPPPPAAEPSPPPAAAAAAAPPAPATPKTEQAPNGSRGGVRFEVGALLPVGVVPAPRGGIRAGGGVGFGLWSLGVEGMFLFPSSQKNPAGSGEVSAYVLGGAVVPCALPVASESWGLGLCAVGTLGALRSTANDVTRAAPATDLYASAGPRAAVFVMLSRAVGLGVSADVPVTLTRAHLYIEQAGQRQEVWAQAPVGFIGAVSLLLSSIP